MNDVTIGTYSMQTDFKLYLPEYTIPSPSPQTKFVSIIGRDGAVDLTNALGLHYDSRKWTLDFKCFDPTVNWHTLMTNVMNAIHGKRLNFEFADDSTHYWTGRFNVVSYTPKKGEGTVRIEITSDPFKYAKTSTTVTASVPNGTTYTGVPATFTATANDKIVSAKASIVPVQAGSGTPSPSNIRPISGWTGASICNLQKNLFCELAANWKLGWVIPAGGVEEENSAYKYCQTYFPVEPSTQYAMQAEKTSSVSAAFTLIYYDENKSFMSRNVIFTSSASAGLKTGTFTTPSGCHYIRMNVPKTQAKDIQIEKGGECTDYEIGATYSVDWTSAAGTVYGGTIDMATGLLTVTKGMVDMGDLSWTKYDSDVAAAGYAFYASVGGKKGRDTGMMCSKYWTSDIAGFAETYAEYGINDKLCFSGSSSNTRVYIADSDYSTAEALKTSLDGVQLVYTLATPLTYQLTPQVVSAIVGVNHIWSNIDNVSVFLGNPIALVNSGAKSVIPTVTASASMVLSWKNYTYSLEAGTSVIPQLVLESGTTNVYVDGTGTIKFEYAEASL